MKSFNLALLAALLLAIAWLALPQKETIEASAKLTERQSLVANARNLPSQSPPEREVEEIEMRTAPSAMPEITKSNVNDPEATAALIEVLARHPAEKARLEEENQWVKRRELVQVKNSFRDLAKQILAGKKVEQFEVPLFDGETATVLLDQENSEVFSETSGALFGEIEGEPEAFVALAFYKDSDSGLINFPSRDLTIQYEGFGDRKVIVKDFDESAQAKALPCEHCRLDGHSSGHATHPTPQEPANN